MKPSERVKKLELGLADALRERLERVPSVHVRSLETEASSPGRDQPSFRPDILAEVETRDSVVTLVCEVKEEGSPRQVRGAIAQLHAYRPPDQAHTVLLVGALWLSAQSRALCEDAGVGWLDLAGNCRIAFDNVYIERETTERPKPATRSFKAIFAPKAARVLHTLLRDPSRAWKVADLAQASGVSLGHVSNVRTALLDREWATIDQEGLRVTAPDALLDAWRDDYTPVRGRRSSWYSVLHGRQLDEALRTALGRPEDAGLTMLGGLSAAHWLAPYLRSNMTTIYTDASVAPRLIETLKLKPVRNGANVELIEPDDPDIIKERVELAGAPPLSSPVLTYLDLSHLDDRGREAADHLRERLLQWP